MPHGKKAASKTPMDAYVDGCRATSISTGHPTRKSRRSSSRPTSRPANASGSRRHSKPCLPSLERTFKSASLNRVALRSGIQERTVPAGVGVNLRAVQRHRPHLQNAHLPRQQQHSNEQSFDLREKAPPERRDRVVVGMIVGRDEPERHRVVRRTLQLTARKHPRRIAVNQKAQQHSRMIRRRPGTAITAAHRAKIEGGSKNPVSRSIVRKLLIKKARRPARINA